MIMEFHFGPKAAMGRAARAAKPNAAEWVVVVRTKVVC